MVHKRMESNAWKVTLNGKWIDTVFFDKNLDKDYVKDSLINHDNYNPNINVRRDRKKEKLGKVI